MFNYNHLYYFYFTAKLGGVMRASKELHISQPSLSAQLKVLESQIGKNLFVKRGRRMVLSPLGEHVFLYCEQMFNAAIDLRNFLQNTETSKVTRVKVSVSNEIERTFVANTISAIIQQPLKRTPDLNQTISMSTLSNDQAESGLASGTIQFAITHKSIQSSNAYLVAKLKVPVVAVSSHKFVKAPSGRSESIFSILKKTNCGLVLPTESIRHRIETDVFLQKGKITNKIAFESDVLASVVRATVEGVGVTFLPLAYVKDELRNRTLSLLGRKTDTWDYYIFVYGDKKFKNGPLGSKFKEHFENLQHEYDNFFKRSF